MKEVLKNREMIEEVRAEVRGSFEEVWENLTKLRADLTVVPYARRKPPTHAASQRGPMIDEYGAQFQAAMEMSRREHEERLRAERDPRGKGQSVDEPAESSDDD